MTNTNNQVRMEAKHENGSILQVAKRRDLRLLILMRDCGYTHVRMVTWGWEPIAVAIDSATPCRQPEYTDCHNCGTADHASYHCPCGCHQ